VKGKAKIVAELKKAGKEAKTIYIGSDPDREGEAIAFHVAEEIGKGVPVKRVLFNEITKKAVLEAMKSPQALDESKYEAQKARRILDRLVGYGIRPLRGQGAVSGPQARLREGGRDRGLRQGRILDHRGRFHTRLRRDLQGEAREDQRREDEDRLERRGGKGEGRRRGESVRRLR